MKHVQGWIERISYATTMVAISATSALAAGAGAGVLPWDGPITTITADMTGPVGARRHYRRDYPRRDGLGAHRAR
jgi:hypothetical protein